jgi:hypothetical protein
MSLRNAAWCRACPYVSVGALFVFALQCQRPFRAPGILHLLATRLTPSWCSDAPGAGLSRLLAKYINIDWGVKKVLRRRVGECAVLQGRSYRKGAGRS